MRFRSIMLCAAISPLLTAAAEPVRLQPSSQWVVDYAENSCRLIRTFGDGNNQTKLAFESAAPGSMDLLVVGRPVQTNDEQVPATFLPIGGKPFDGMAVKAVNGDPAVLWSKIPMLRADALAKRQSEEAEQKRHPGHRPSAVSVAEQQWWRAERQQFAAAATELEILVRHNPPVILETGSLGAPIVAFDKCSRDSLKDWGVDPDLEDKIVRPVWAVNPLHWLTADDYPQNLLARGAESDVSVRLLIDASGKVTKCTSLSHFDEPEFNRISCDRITQRARFEPAELADGTKVPSYYIQRIDFRIRPYPNGPL